MSSVGYVYTFSGKNSIYEQQAAQECRWLRYDCSIGGGR